MSMNRSLHLFIFTLFSGVSLFAQVDTLQSTDTTHQLPDTANNSSMIFRDSVPSIDPAEMEKGVWVGIHGTVGMVGPNSFFLDHGDSTVIVGLTGEALREHDFARGQKVVVYGKADKDFFGKHIIKARAVATEGVDGAEHSVVSENAQLGVLKASYVPASVVHGKVSAVTGTRIVLDEGENRISIDSSALPADHGVKQGDLVRAQGTLGHDLWKERLFKATAIEVIDPTIIEAGSEQKAGMEISPDGEK